MNTTKRNPINSLSFRRNNSNLRKKNKEILLKLFYVTLILVIIGLIVFFSIKLSKNNQDKDNNNLNADNTDNTDNANNEDNADDDKEHSLSDRMKISLGHTNDNNSNESNLNSNKTNNLVNSVNNVNHINSVNGVNGVNGVNNVNGVNKEDIIDGEENVKIPTASNDRKEVYQVFKNLWTYDEAEAVCKLQGAELATYEQLVDAASSGAHQCNQAWIKSEPETNNLGERRLAYYPVQQEEFNKNKDKCGKKFNNSGHKDFNNKSYALQGGLFHKNTQFGVNCYGVKRDMTNDEKWLLRNRLQETENRREENKQQEIYESVKEKIGDKKLFLNAFYNVDNKNKWSKYD